MLWLLGGLPTLAQRLTADQQTELESRGYRLYRVSGRVTVSSTLAFEKTVDRSMAGLTDVSQHKVNRQSQKTAWFSGETYFTPPGSTGDCQHELQTNDDPVGWVTLMAGGGYQAKDTHNENRRLAAQQGACTTASYREVLRGGAIDPAGAYVNFCVTSARQWSLEVTLRYQHVMTRTNGQEQTCEAGAVKTTQINDAMDDNADVLAAAGSDKPGGSVSVDGNGFTVNHTETRTERETVLDLLNDEGTAIRTTTIQLTFTCTPLPTLVACVEPLAGMAEFGQWLPKGPDPQLDHSTGNAVAVEVYLKSRKYPGQKRKMGIREVRYTLDGVSHEPGWAMNYPNKDPLTTADLGLYRANELPNPQIEQLTLTVTKVQNPDLTALVHCFDYGASGRLRATVVLDDGTQLTAQNPGNGQAFLPIPYRHSLQSPIADHWRQTEQAGDRPDNADDEDGQGVGDHAGDGLTLFEEYRGFIENNEHIRTSARHKDVFICNQIIAERDRVEDGIALYQSVTKLNVHKKFRAEEFGREETRAVDRPLYSKYGIPPFNYNRVLNSNSSPATHLVDQHGIVMVPSAMKLGAAFAMPRPDGVFNSTPKNYLFLVMPADFNPGPRGYVQTQGRINPDGSVSGGDNLSDTVMITTDFYASRVAHELLHCSHVRHHGDGDYWYGRYYSNGQQLFFQETTNTGLGVDKDNNGTADTMAVTLTYGLMGSQISPTDPRWAAEGGWANGRLSGFVARQGGQHSGLIDCIMRYDQAVIVAKEGKHHMNAIPLATPADYNPNYLLNQLTGLTLCTSAEPTGANVFGFPRGMGPATYGNCRGQVCVNDKYH